MARISLTLKQIWNSARRLIRRLWLKLFPLSDKLILPNQINRADRYVTDRYARPVKRG